MEKSFVTAHIEDVNGKMLNIIIFQGDSQEVVKFYMNNKAKYRELGIMLTTTLVK